MKVIAEKNSSINDKTVLIVDDYSENIELMKLFVKEAGADSLTASNGLECMEIVQNNKIDMILLDLNMPEMNGWQTVKALRENPKFKNLVVIGVTGYEDEDEMELCRQAGMNDAVPKFTFSPEKLIEIANIYLE